MIAASFNAEAEFMGAILATLGYAPSHVEPGRFKRFGPRKSAWAKLFHDCLGGVFGDYRQGISSHWSAVSKAEQTPAELAAMRRQIQQAAIEREAEQREQWANNEKRNAALWESA